MENHRLTPDFRAFIACLETRSADYLLVGGYAVGLHGHVRNTTDIGLWVGHEPANAKRVFDAVTDFVGSADHLSPELFAAEDSMVMIGVEPYRLDILTGIPGVVFSDCLPRAERMQLDGIDVRVIDRADLIESKRAAGRQKDLLDVEALLGG